MILDHTLIKIITPSIKIRVWIPLTTQTQNTVFSKKKPLKSVLDNGGKFSLEISTVKKTNINIPDSIKNVNCIVSYETFVIHYL